MKFNLSLTAKSMVGKQLIGAIAGLTALTQAWSGVAHADPVQELNDLSRQAQQLTESLQSTKVDLDRKLQLQREADIKHADDLAALDAARAQLAIRQGAVDKFIAAVYMGGRADGLNAILTAASPKTLIDKLAFQREMFTGMSDELHSYRMASQEAQTIEAASAKSAADAKAAADEVAAARADLQHRQSELRTRVATVRARYGMLPAAQLTAFGPVGSIPTVGMSGLVPNAMRVVAYVLATYPGVQSIGGVRADPIPDHPSGHAVDIMTGSNMALGDAINADLQSQAGNFGVVYTMWRVANHFNHVHVTVS